MGCFYVGYNYLKRKNGYMKIGETSGETPAARFSAIRSKEHFEPLAYIKIKGETKSQRLLVEAYVREKLEHVPELTHTQNDHYLYSMASVNEKHNQAMGFAKIAIKHACEMCKTLGLKYEIGKKTYKRG